VSINFFKDTITSATVTYWNYLCLTQKLDGEMGKTCKQIIEQVEKIRLDWTTEESKGRSWFRVALNKNYLYLIQPLIDSEYTRKWYSPDAIFLNPDYTAVLMSLLAGLGEVQFALPLEDIQEDAQFSSELKPLEVKRKKVKRKISNEETKKRLEEKKKPEEKRLAEFKRIEEAEEDKKLAQKIRTRKTNCGRKKISGRAETHRRTKDCGRPETRRRTKNLGRKKKSQKNEESWKKNDKLKKEN
jgi:hypothetical protein